MFLFISWQLQVLIKLFSCSKKAKDKTRLVLTGWEYKQSLYFRFCFYATIPLQHKLVLLWFARLAQFCIFASLIVFCSCQCVKSNPIFELFCFEVCVIFKILHNVLQSLLWWSLNDILPALWSFFWSSCFLFLSSCWAVRRLSPFKLRFPFLTSQVVLNCFYVSYMGRKAGDGICLCSLFLCSAGFLTLWPSWLCSNPLY